MKLPVDPILRELVMEFILRHQREEFSFLQALDLCRDANGKVDQDKLNAIQNEDYFDLTYFSFIKIADCFKSVKLKDQSYES